MQVGLGFGALLERFLVDFGAKLGGKLEPNWGQNRENWGPQRMSKNHQKNGAAVNAEWGGVPALNRTQIQLPKGVKQHWGASATLHFGP